MLISRVLLWVPIFQFLFVAQGWALPEECKKNCVTDFNTLLGVYEGIPAFSNCSHKCKSRKHGKFPSEEIFSQHYSLYKDDYSLFHKYFKHHRSALNADRWTSIQYVKFYLLFKEKVVPIYHDGDYPPPPSSDDSFNFSPPKESARLWNDVTSVVNLASMSDPPEVLEFRNFENGGTEPPQKGDIVVYFGKDSSGDDSSTDPRTDHVAIIADVDLSEGTVYFAEQNFKNEVWKEIPRKNETDDRVFYARLSYLEVKEKSGKMTHYSIGSGLPWENVKGWKRIIRPASPRQDVQMKLPLSQLTTPRRLEFISTPTDASTPKSPGRKIARSPRTPRPPNTVSPRRRNEDPSQNQEASIASNNRLRSETEPTFYNTPRNLPPESPSQRESPRITRIKDFFRNMITPRSTEQHERPRSLSQSESNVSRPTSPRSQEQAETAERIRKAYQLAEEKIPFDSPAGSRIEQNHN